MRNVRALACVQMPLVTRLMIPITKRSRRINALLIRERTESYVADPLSLTCSCCVSRRQVLPGLYIGNYHDSKDADQLERFEITHILAIHDTARRLHSVSIRKYIVSLGSCEFDEISPINYFLGQTLSMHIGGGQPGPESLSVFLLV